ncbi:MAG: c-type cytochrome biogenesis protein CcmI [Gammaproteobacteria bacterium]|nr:c-type cytochrome biogenesis protein CcmI [Gammaproteobacteria bacterium]MCY4274356.1 c-type cytochrome biogenesis protein CcmI [Gammaproteobacteria bacterium]
MIPALIMLLLTTVAIIAVLPVLLNRFRIEQNGREHSNTDIALYRMDEIQHMDHEDRIEAEDEIKNNLLEDTKTKQTLNNKIIPFRYSLWIPVFLIGISLGLYYQIGDPSLMFGTAQHPQTETTAIPENIEEMIRQLEEKIEQNPNNIESLEVAGNVYSTIGKSLKAEAVYRRLNDLSPGNPDYLTSLANAVILNNNDTYTLEAETYIKQALAIDPQHQNAIWISALGASSRGEIENSIEQLEFLLTLIQDEQEVRQSLLTMIKQQRALLNNNVENAEVDQGKILTVEIALDKNLFQYVSSNDIVFVTAKATNGPSAPLAIRKLAVGDLPKTVQLSSADSMIENMTVDQFEDIIIQARISKSGTAQRNSGDVVSNSIQISGEPEEILSLTIDEIIQ